MNNYELSQTLIDLALLKLGIEKKYEIISLLKDAYHYGFLDGKLSVYRKDDMDELDEDICACGGGPKLEGSGVCKDCI